MSCDQLPRSSVEAIASLASAARACANAIDALAAPVAQDGTSVEESRTAALASIANAERLLALARAEIGP